MLQDAGPEVRLTLKKRPKHAKIYAQIYMTPFKLNEMKKNRYSDSLPSPRIDLIPSLNFPMPLPLSRIPEKRLSDDSDSSCSDILTPTEPKKVHDRELRLYLPKPRAVLQRRNTICGDRASGFKGNVVFWHEHRGGASRAAGAGRMEQDSPSLRDKSVSFGFGLEMTARPTTCIGIQNVNAPLGRFADFSLNSKGSLPKMNGGKKIWERRLDNGPPAEIQLAKPPTPKLGISKVVRFDANMRQGSEMADDKYTCKIDTTIVETFEPIPYVDEDDAVPPAPPSDARGGAIQPDAILKSTATDLAEAVNVVVINKEQERRNALAKSSSEPAYDKGSNDDEYSDDSDSGKTRFFFHRIALQNETSSISDVPPAIEPRISKTPPAVPPRPRKSTDSSPLSGTTQLAASQQSPSVFISSKVTSVLTPSELHFDENSNKSKLANVIDLKKRDILPPARAPIAKSMSTDSIAQSPAAIPAAKHFLEDCFEELELLTPPKTKNLTLKKKNSLLAKRRKISLKALDGSDIQGHLYRRTKDKHGVTYWAKLYFVLVDTALYGFQTKESSKANCLIFLSGFTVSTATEVHSKRFAFKVYHPKKTFYFAAESQQALSQWMEYIKRATLKGNMATIDLEMDHNIKDLFSETESSDEDLDLGTSKFYSPLLTAKSGTNLNLLGSCTGRKQHDDTPPPAHAPKSEKYHLGFGSLKKFTKQNLPFTNKDKDKDKDKDEKKKVSSDTPVPTAQFRSYRKVPGSAGMQLGTTAMINSDFMATLPTNPFETPNHVIHPLPDVSSSAVRIENARKNSITSLSSANQMSVSTSSISSSLQTPASPAILTPIPQSPIVLPPTPTHPMPNAHIEPIDELAAVSPGKPTPLRDIKKSKSKISKAPFNYIHASNPNLVEFTFQTSKTLDYTLPKISSHNMVETPHNLQGFVTLKDLMLQKQEEERQDMYNNRVNLGVEKDKNNKRKGREAIFNVLDSMNRDTDDGDPLLTKIQSRTLPKTPDYAQSFKLDDSDIIMARTKEGQKLRDFGYEFISGDDATTGAGSSNKYNVAKEMNARLNDRDRLMIAAISAGNSVSVSKKKALNWISTAADNRKVDDKSNRPGSFKKTRTKLVAETFENFKSSSEKIFQFKYGQNHINEKDGDGGKQKVANEKVSPLKPATSYSPMTLPLNRKTSNLININLNNGQYGASTSGGPLKKSQTSNLNEFRENLERKNSAPTERTASYFTKLSFPNKTAKEKKLLGSPRLHRAIFGRRDNEHHLPIDHEVFSPIEYGDVVKAPAPLPNQPPAIQPRQYEHHGDTQLSSAYGSSSSSINQIRAIPPKAPSTVNNAASVVNVDYPHLEYPPTFMPETYSLSDPNASLTLLRRRHHPMNSNQNGK